MNIATGHRLRFLLFLAVVQAVGSATGHSTEAMLAEIDAARSHGASGEQQNTKG